MRFLPINQCKINYNENVLFCKWIKIISMTLWMNTLQSDGVKCSIINDVFVLTMKDTANESEEQFLCGEFC